METTEELKKLYTRWLKGDSLRTIAATQNVRHGTIHSRFKKAFGQNACNPVATSLVRSMLEDYPDDPEVLDFVISLVNDGVIEEKQHRSKHSMAMLTSYQTLDEDGLLDIIAYSEDPLEQELDFLRLPLYRLFVEALVVVLDEQTRSAESTKEAA